MNFHKTLLVAGLLLNAGLFATTSITTVVNNSQDNLRVGSVLIATGETITLNPAIVLEAGKEVLLVPQKAGRPSIKIKYRNVMLPQGSSLQLLYVQQNNVKDQIFRIEADSITVEINNATNAAEYVINVI